MRCVVEMLVIEAERYQTRDGNRVDAILCLTVSPKALEKIQSAHLPQSSVQNPTQWI